MKRLKSNHYFNRYLKLFPGDNFIGLTAKSNDSPELKDIMKKFKIYASKIEYEEEDENVKINIHISYFTHSFFHFFIYSFIINIY